MSNLDKVLYNFARRGVLPQFGSRIIGGGNISLDSNGRPFAMQCGKDYYVSSYFGVAGNDGSCWEKSMLTLAEAITASNAWIAASAYGTAARNRIFVSGPFTENLVAFPNKCDVIGAGSDTYFDMPLITGNHAPVNAANYGTRFANIGLVGPAVASPLITLVSSTSGLQLLGCTMRADAVTTMAVSAVASPYLKLEGCKCEGAFATSYITFGAGSASGSVLRGNVMLGAAAGGVLTDAGTTAAVKGLIADNIIQAVGVTLDTQAVSVFVVVGNRLISAGALGATSHVIDLTFANNNLITGNDVGIAVPKHIDA